MTHTECPLCKCNLYNIIKGYENHSLVICSSCSFIFVSKIPDSIELNNFYLYYGIYNYFSPLIKHSYNKILSEFEKYRQKNYILDIGCGAGHFLESAKDKGWNVYGIEFSIGAINICTEKNINIINSNSISEYDNIEFDVIVFSETIEHLSFPKIYLKYIYDHLRMGGAMYITTPNFNCLTRKLLKNNWYNFNYPEHLCFFTTQSLTNLLSRNGFKLKKLKTSGLSFSGFTTSKKIKKHHTDISTNVFINKEDEKLRKLIKNQKHFQVLKNLVNFFLNILGIGDTIKCLSVKTDNKFSD